MNVNDNDYILSVYHKRQPRCSTSVEKRRKISGCGTCHLEFTPSRLQLQICHPTAHVTLFNEYEIVIVTYLFIEHCLTRVHTALWQLFTMLNWWCCIIIQYVIFMSRKSSSCLFCGLLWSNTTVGQLQQNKRELVVNCRKSSTPATHLSRGVIMEMRHISISTQLLNYCFINFHMLALIYCYGNFIKKYIHYLFEMIQN